MYFFLAVFSVSQNIFSQRASFSLYIRYHVIRSSDSLTSHSVIVFGWHLYSYPIL